MKKTKKMALAAILSALSVVILFLGSVINILDLTAVALASIVIMVAVIELGGAYPYLIWLVSGILALIIVPDKFGALLYLVFGGIYPIFKSFFERLHYIISWVLKFSCFNTMLTLVILISKFVMHLPDTGFDFELVLYGICNFTFLLYDIATTQLITIYLVKLRKQLGLGNFFK